MESDDRALKIEILLEEYRTISEELRVIVSEMIKCFTYGAILIALYLGWGLGDQTSSFATKVRDFVPFGFVVLSVYFLALSYIRIGMSRHRAELEYKINQIVGHDLMGWESSYIVKMQSAGFLRLGESWFARLPTPILFFGFLIAVAAFIVFSIDSLMNQRLILLASLMACGLTTLYVFFVYPKLLDRAKRISQQPSESWVRKEMIEVFTFLGLALLYIAFKDYFAGKAIFILPVIFLCIGYIIYSLIKDPNLLREFGIRSDNMMPAMKLSVFYFVPVAIIILVIFLLTGSSPPPSSFYYLLLFYPIWGIFQQFLFQSFFHTRLIRLGLTPWSILVVAIVYAIVHFPSTKLMLMCFVGGIISSYIFLKYPNIIPLGIAHGLLGAMIYYLILKKDVLKSFVGALQ